MITMQLTFPILRTNVWTRLALGQPLLSLLYPRPEEDDGSSICFPSMESAAKFVDVTVVVLVTLAMGGMMIPSPPDDDDDGG